MSDLLFEIGTEELPDWYVTQAHEALPALMRERLEAVQLEHGDMRSFATPRRIAVIVEDVAATTRQRVEERRGPPAGIAFDEEGIPTKAALGFAETNGVRPEDLEVEETDKGKYVFVRKRVGGAAAEEVLPGLLAEIVADLPAPRKMRWAEVPTPFVRPVAWLLAKLGTHTLELEAAGVRSGDVSYGHRFLAPGPVAIYEPATYVGALRDAEVLADVAERREATWNAASEAAAARSLSVVEDPGLLAEVGNLVEAPFGILGTFDDAYLALPDEVLTTVMIRHQRYFPTRHEDGSLASSFVGVSNNRVPDEDVVRRGYEQVLSGRLYDARFFWDADRAKSLSQHAWGLSGIGFHKELGTMADKVARVGDGAKAMAAVLELNTAELGTLEKALPIFRSDLATDMVYEFPELEGTMAKAYALADGQPKAVADALEGGVQPKGPTQPLPATSVGALLAVADRLDKLVGFFALDRRPTGSADPFGLRRDGVSIARILNARGWRVAPSELIGAAVQAYADAKVDVALAVASDVDTFLWDRISALLAEEGMPVSIVRAACADHPPVITAARRAHLLATLSQHEEFPQLLTLYKRAANLATKAETDAVVDPDRFEDPHEPPLHRALPDAGEGVSALMAAARKSLTPWDLGRGPAGSLPSLDAEIGAILALKEPLDEFLDNVLVMVDDKAVRRNRLALLREVQVTLGEFGRLEELEGI